MYLKSNARAGHKMDMWKEWKLQDGKKSSTEKSRYMHKIIMLLPKKGHLGAQFITFHSTTVTLQITDSFSAPHQCVEFVHKIFLPISYVTETGVLHWSWTPTSPSGQQGIGRAHTEEIYVKCLRRGLALWMSSCDWWDQMSNAEGLQWVQWPTSLGKGEASVDMRQLPLSTYVCHGRLAKLSSLAVCDSFGYSSGYCTGDNYGCLPLANNLLQSSDKITPLSQRL